MPYGDREHAITLYRNGYKMGTNSSFKSWYDHALKRFRYVKHDIPLSKTDLDRFVENNNLRYIGE